MKRHGYRGALAILGIPAVIAAVAMLVAWRDTTVHPAEAQVGQAPPNDRFEFKQGFIPPNSPYGSPSLPFEAAYPTGGATLEPGESAPCADIGATVWYEWYADRGGTLAIDTAGSNFDTVVAVYAFDWEDDFLPSPPGGNLRDIACNDDANGQTSRVSVPIEQFTSYLIQVGGKGGATGDLRFRAACEPACPPPNDNQQTAEYFYLDAYQQQFTTTADTRAATLEPGEVRPCANTGATVWYQFQPGQDTGIVVEANGSGFDAVLAVFTFDEVDFSQPSPPGGFMPKPQACSDDGGSVDARVAFQMKANVGYWFQVGGRDGTTGDVTVTARCEPACPPWNDHLGNNCCGTPPWTDDISTVGATRDPGEPRPCGEIGATVWYGLTVPGDTRVTVRTAGNLDTYGQEDSDFDTIIAIYRDLTPYSEQEIGDFSGLDVVDCEEGTSLSFDAEASTADLSNANVYWVQVGGAGADSGMLHLSIDCDPRPCPPYADGISNANWIYAPESLPWIDYWETQNATTEDGEPLACGDIGKTVWYHFQTSVPVDLVVDTAGSSIDTAVAAYEITPTLDTVSDLDEARQAACAPGGPGQRARLVMHVEPGESRWLQVGGRNGAGGNLQVQLNCDGPCPPPNDSVLGAWEIWPYDGPYYDYKTTLGATTDDGEDLSCGNMAHTVWYRINSSEGGTVEVHAGGSNFQVAIAAHALDGFSPPGGLQQVSCDTDGRTGATRIALDPNRAYYVQAGGVDSASGDLQIQVACVEGCPRYASGGQGGGGGSGGIVAGPDTGSGGYLPQAHH